MCCPAGNGCGRGCGNCGGSNPEGGAVGGAAQSREQTAQELRGIVGVVRGFFHTGGNWVEVVDSMRRWACERVGCTAECMTALANCFSHCSGRDGTISRDELNSVLVQLSLECGIPAVCLTLERLSGRLGEICHKPKEEAEEILKAACAGVVADLREAEGVLVQTEADESSVLNPNMRDLGEILDMIRRVCEAVSDAEALAAVVASRSDGADGASGSSSR